MQSLSSSFHLLFNLSQVLLLILLFLPSSSALPSCSPSDLISLQSFQASISNILPWRNQTDCCLWLGVRCNSHGHVVSLHLPSSNLSGSISPHLFQLSALQSLNLSGNSLYGNVAPGIANLSKLTRLDLSHNPSLRNGPSMPLQLPSSLEYLDISHCGLHGSVDINASSSLKELFIGDNFLTSFALINLASMKALQTFDAPRNFLAAASVLQTLRYCTNLRVLNLDYNVHVGGSIPSEIGMLSKLEILRLRGNGIAGYIPQDIGNCNQMREIWLDKNHLTGTIPKEIGKLSLLTHLSLSNNRLYGPVPDAIIIGCGKLLHLSLSGNMPSEDIPAGFTDLSRSDAKLAGISDSMLGGIWILGRPGRLDGASKTRVKSSFLRGYLNPSEVTEMEKSLYHHHGRHLLQSSAAKHSSTGIRRPLITGVIAGLAVFCGILLIALVVCLCRTKVNPWRKMHGAPKDPPRLPSLRRIRCESISQVFDPSLTSISMKDLVKATGNFHPEKVIGDGGFGLVYRATLGDGRTVAVKKLATDGIQGKREFEAELQTLGRIKHANLVELLAFCRVGDDRALVYEFIENGSLDTWLHERDDGPRLLDWKTRVQIATGAAKGLAYLHHECNPHVLHRDIKSSNILLGRDFEARIADFGLARHVSPFISHVSTEAAGTLGYMAPEYHMTLHSTRPADVYSFGVLMLELASGMRPNSVLEGKPFRTLTTWVHHAVESGCEMDILDPVLKENPPPHDQVRAYMAVARVCVSERPQDRPTIMEAYKQLSGQLDVNRANGENAENSAEMQNEEMEDGKGIM